jgi:pilus assembly protein Flp/PilA
VTGNHLLTVIAPIFRNIHLPLFTNASVISANLPRPPAENGMSALIRFLRDEAGTTAIEYGLIAFGLSIVIVGSVNAIGGSVKNLFTNVSTGLN